MREVYMDNNATTPLHEEVVKAINNFAGEFGNASSLHLFGRKAKDAIEKARGEIASFIGAQNDEIIFTSGGSEANNLVLKGATCTSTFCKSLSTRTGRHIITSQIEHPSVLGTCKCLESEGYSVTYLPVDQYGFVAPEDVEKAINPNTILISIMLANNEIGIIEPIADIAKIARKHKIHFHTDAVQGVGKIPVNVKTLDVDFLSISAHKINGPKGIGALYVSKNSEVCAIIHGGHQERGKRAGTENTLGIIGFAKSMEITKQNFENENKRLLKLKQKLWKGIEKRISDIKLNGHPEICLPGTLNVSFKYVEGESILFRLDAQGIAISTGSACSSGSLEPSHVLIAIGLPHEIAHGSIRFSLGYFNTEEDVDYVLEKLPVVISELREMSPLYKKAG